MGVGLQGLHSPSSPERLLRLLDEGSLSELALSRGDYALAQYGGRKYEGGAEGWWLACRLLAGSSGCFGRRSRDRDCERWPPRACVSAPRAASTESIALAQAYWRDGTPVA